MWESIKDIPRGRLSTRKLIGFVPALLVACFLYILFATPTTYAVDATRTDDAITYEGKTYKQDTSNDSSNGLGLKDGATYFVNLNTDDFSNNGSGDVAVLTFADNSDAKTATEAQLRTGTYNAQDGRFTGLSPPTTVTIADVDTQNASATPRTSCDLSGVGWFVCPVSDFIADGVDFAYGVLSNFFVFESLTAGGQTNSIYNLWGYVRNIANICFIIAFLIVIYSQMTSGAMSNYTVKKLLPRIIVAAILVNTSYWICAIGIDISNILGTSIQDFLKNIRGGLGAANTQDFPTWGDVTTNILAGGGIILGTGAVIAATGGTVGGLIFLLLAALVPAMFAVLVAVAILAARQALITVFIIIAPLAFVAYLLPNTEEWFTRWRKLFTTMLMMFPAFSLIFGASQLIGIIIIQNANDITVVLLGMTVQVVPLFVTPFLIRLSSGLLGTIAGLANDNSKGIFDRTKNWANNNRELHRQRGFSTQQRNGIQRLRPTNMARALNNRTLKREGETAAHKAVAKARFDATPNGQSIHKRLSDAKLYQGQADANNQEAWTQGVRASNYRREAFEGTYMATGRAKILEEDMTNSADARLQRQVKQNYGGLRTVSQTSHTSAEKAKSYKEAVESANQQHWEEYALNDPTIRGLKLETYTASQSAKQAEEKWNGIIANIEAVGSAAPNLNPGEARMADQIQKVTEQLSAEALRKSNAETEKQSRLTDTLLKDTTLIDGQTIREYAGGVRGDAGAESVLASAVANKRKEYIEKIGEKGQLAKHFNLSSSNRQKLALGESNVTATRDDGTSYVFKIDDEYVRESMISEQLKTGSFPDIEAIIAASGVGGAANEYATTIAEDIVSNGLANKGLYFGSKTIDDVAQGKILGEAGLYDAALYHISAGKVKDTVLAGQSPGALKRMFMLGETPRLAPDYATLDPAKQQEFSENALALRESAKRILEDPILLSQTDTASRKVLEEYAAE